MSLRDDAAKAVKAYFFEKMDERTKELRHAARWDLIFGPYPADYYEEAHDTKGWTGYADAVGVLEAWSSEHLCEVWVDIQVMEVSDKAPGDDVLAEDYYHFERRDAAKAVFMELVTDGGMNP